MASNVTHLDLPARMAPLPEPMRQSCDYGLDLTVGTLVRQMGSIEAYNRLVNAAKDLRTKINSGDIMPPKRVE